ncbi:MAG: hypothetical protein ACKO7B_06455, partial [Flavobacteriales bacterium]
MKLLLALTISFFLATRVLAEVVIISGIYQGKDLYVKNPMTADGAGYCVFEVLVNGQVTADQLNSASFAVDLAIWKLGLGDPLEIVLRCKENCEVKILNPEVIYPNSTFKMISCTISPSGTLEWKTENESSPLNFVVEQFRWNKWIKVGEVKGKGKPEECSYNFTVNLHSGTNTVRIYQMDFKGQHTSDEYKVTSTTPEVKLKSAKISNSIDFSAVTDYEIVSEFGTMIASGRGATV